MHIFIKEQSSKQTSDIAQEFTRISTSKYHVPIVTLYSWLKKPKFLVYFSSTRNWSEGLICQGGSLLQCSNPTLKFLFFFFYFIFWQVYFLTGIFKLLILLPLLPKCLHYKHVPPGLVFMLGWGLNPGFLGC